MCSAHAHKPVRTADIVIYLTCTLRFTAVQQFNTFFVAQSAAQVQSVSFNIN